MNRCSRFKTQACIAAVMLSGIGVAGADERDRANDQAPPRPAILFNRWQEDWSVLADPRVPREPLDSLKYIPLSSDDPKTYLSLGAGLRERFEANDATSFAVGTNRNQDYVISRAEVSADLRAAGQLQLFVQLQKEN